MIDLGPHAAIEVPTRRLAIDHISEGDWDGFIFVLVFVLAVETCRRGGRFAVTQQAAKMENVGARKADKVFGFWYLVEVIRRTNGRM